MIPILRFADGIKVGYLARDPRPAEERGDSPKYVMPAGLQKHLELFGSWPIKNGLTEAAARPLRVVYVLESPLAVLKFAQLALPAVSPFGWSVSPAQASIVAQLARGAVFLPDRNKWDQSAEGAGLLARHIWIRMPSLPEGVDDPEQLSAEQIRALTGQA